MKTASCTSTVTGTVPVRSERCGRRWDWQAVEARLRQAGETLRVMPDYQPGRSSGYWPPVLREFSDLVYQAELRRLGGIRNVPARPSPVAIEEMHEALGWLYWIEDDRERSIVMARAVGNIPWRALQARVERRNRAGRVGGVGLGRTQLHKLYKAGLDRVARRLREGG